MKRPRAPRVRPAAAQPTPVRAAHVAPGRAEDEQTLIVRDHDRGLDARLPDPMGRLTMHGWHAKRFATGEVQWSQCEASVRAALAFWRPFVDHFVFADDLSAAEQHTFTMRLIEVLPVVRLNYWSAQEVLRRMPDWLTGVAECGAATAASA